MKEKDSLLNRILNHFGTQAGLNGLLAMSEHHNGFKREKAVRQLGALGNPVAIPRLLIRVNDWVPQVSTAAKEALKQLFTHDNAEAFVLSLPELYHLQQCGRQNHDAFIADVIRFLIEPDNASHVRSAVRHENAHIARIAIRICTEHSLMDKYELAVTCLGHQDVIVRVIAADLLREIDEQQLEPLLQQAIRDPFMPVRREAFQLYLKSRPEQGLEIANILLFDKHVGIREIAIRKLLQNGIDVEKILVDTLQSPNQTIPKIKGAIHGLAEIDSKPSVSLVSEYAHHASPGVRKASLQSLAKLLDEQALPCLLEGLRDASPAVAKGSAQLLNKLAPDIDIKDLLSIVEESEYQHTLTACLSSTKKLNKWDRLIFLLGAYQLVTHKAGNGGSQLLDGELNKWDSNFNRKQSQPTVLQKKSIRTAYRNSGDLLLTDNRCLLEFTLKSCGIVV